MLELAITWLQTHPLEGVAGLAAIGIGAALALVPALHLIQRHGHPSC